MPQSAIPYSTDSTIGNFLSRAKVEVLRPGTLDGSPSRIAVDSTSRKRVDRVLSNQSSGLSRALADIRISRHVRTLRPIRPDVIDVRAQYRGKEGALLHRQDGEEAPASQDLAQHIIRTISYALAQSESRNQTARQSVPECSLLPSPLFSRLVLCLETSSWVPGHTQTAANHVDALGPGIDHQCRDPVGTWSFLHFEFQTVIVLIPTAVQVFSSSVG